MASLSEVEELYASFNYISDLFDFIYLSKLKILDLEGNNIKEVDSIKYLANNNNLTSINLISNPISKFAEYTKKVQEYIPSIEFIDDKNIKEPNDKIQNVCVNYEEAEKQGLEKNEDILDNPKYEIEMMKTLKAIGIPEERIIEESKSAEKIVQSELNEEELLLSKIKNTKTGKIEVSKNNHELLFNSTLKSNPNSQKFNSLYSNDTNQGIKSMKILFVDSKKARNPQKAIDPGSLLKHFNSNQASFIQVI